MYFSFYTPIKKISIDIGIPGASRSWRTWCEASTKVFHQTMFHERHEPSKCQASTLVFLVQAIPGEPGAKATFQAK